MSEKDKILEIIKQYKDENESYRIENEEIKEEVVKCGIIINHLFKERDRYVTVLRKCDNKELSDFVDTFEDEVYLGKVAKCVSKFELKDVIFEMIIKGYDMRVTDRGIIMKVENRIQFYDIEEELCRLSIKHWSFRT